jgi:hypothetical protein
MGFDQGEEMFKGLIFFFTIIIMFVLFAIGIDVMHIRTDIHTIMLHTK